jgi:hypothetical protein
MTRYSLLLLISVVAGLAFSPCTAQVVHLDAGYQRVNEEAAKYSLRLQPAGEGAFTGRLLSDDGAVIFEGRYIPWKNTYIEDGLFTFFYPDGKIESSGSYERGARTGVWKRYQPDGSARPNRFYPPEGAASLRRVLGIDQG